MTDLLQMLHDERASLVRKLAGVDAAIQALNGTGVPVAKKKRRKMSVAARKRISIAQRARWAKTRKYR
jgi:hypothetical protein